MILFRSCEWHKHNTRKKKLNVRRTNTHTYTIQNSLNFKIYIHVFYISISISSMKNISIFFSMRQFMSKAIFFRICKNCCYSVSKICRWSKPKRKIHTQCHLFWCFCLIYLCTAVVSMCLYFNASMSFLHSQLMAYVCVCLNMFHRRIRLLSLSSFYFSRCIPVGKNGCQKDPLYWHFQQFILLQFKCTMRQLVVSFAKQMEIQRI